MSYQTSKTLGDIWLSLIYEVDEHRKIEGFAAFSALAYAAALAKLYTLDPETEEFVNLNADIKRLESIADMQNISNARDVTVTAKNYSWVMSQIMSKQREILPLCIRHKLIEFSDGARFAGYGEGM